MQLCSMCSITNMVLCNCYIRHRTGGSMIIRIIKRRRTRPSANSRTYRRIHRTRRTASRRQTAQCAPASDLGVNLHTVNKAYAVLRDEGYLVMRGRSGAVIADFRHAATPERIAANAGEARGKPPAARFGASCPRRYRANISRGGTDSGKTRIHRTEPRWSKTQRRCAWP